MWPISIIALNSEAEAFEIFKQELSREVSVKLEYSLEKDVLSIIVLPERNVETRTMGYDHDFLVFHEKLNPRAIIGIEALDFTETASAMDYEGIVLPKPRD